MSPLYYENNIQGEGRCDYEDAQTLKHADLIRREDDYVRKITQEVNQFDNVILEICDEPYLTGTSIELAGPWVGHNVEVIKKTVHTGKSASPGHEPGRSMWSTGATRSS